MRHVATLLTGKLVGRAVSLALVPIIARLFEPHDFGVVALYASLTQGLAMVASGGYFRASLLTDDDRRARILQAMSAWILLAVCVLVVVVVAVAGPSGYNIELLAPLGIWVWLIPAGVFLRGMCNIMAVIEMRYMNFRHIAIADISETFLMGVTRILAGLGGSSVWGLIAGIIVSLSGRLMILARSGLSPYALFQTGMAWVETRALAIEYRDFPLKDMPASLVTFLAGRVPIFMMGIMFAPAVLGYYAMADRMIRMPVLNAAIPVRTVFLRKLAANRNSGYGLRRPVILLTLGMAVLGIVPFGLLGFFGTGILTFLLGDRWADAGIYTQILAPWYYAVWVSAGVQPTLMVLRRQGLWLKFQIGSLLGRLAIFGVGYLAAAEVVTTLKWFCAFNVMSALLVLAIVYILLTQDEGAARRNGTEETEG